MLPTLSFLMRSSVILADLPTGLGDTLLVSSTPTSIPDIDVMIQDNGRPIIKDFKEHHLEEVGLAIENDLIWLKSLNKLQQQGWKINKAVFEVLDKEFDVLIQDVPKAPGIGSSSAVKKAYKALKEKDTKFNRDRYNREVNLWAAELASIIPLSKNLEMTMIREKARKLMEYDTFYQYAELDYRGRAYYHEPLMNFQGSDYARGLFLFAEPKKLGESGLNWLFRHAATCYNETFHKDSLPAWLTYDYKTLLESQGLEDISVDKMTLEDREAWTIYNIPMIYNSTGILKECEKPVSFLAACIEITKAMELMNPEEYECALPIPIDGSCNGYQHSAAIAKDEITGKLVSLTDQDVQADLYTEVAQILIANNSSFFSARPALTMKEVRKGIAKRAVMTRAYSAGKEKISDSMYKDCHSLGYTTSFNISMLDCVELGGSIYDLIKDICPGATKTMKFLQDLASFQLGTWAYFDSNGKKVTKLKRQRLHTRKHQLQKIKYEDMTDEEMEELRVVSAELESHVKTCTRGNGTRFMDWRTPSGFHVFYEGYIQKEIKVKSTIPGYSGGAKNRTGGRINFVVQVETEYPDIQIFQAGISPNFIHSIDASHMAIVIAHWEGSFGAIHDSFSTHASDVDALGGLTREAFVAIYDLEDPYKAIADMVLTGSAALDISYPATGQLDIKEVLKSKYFFC